MAHHHHKCASLWGIMSGKCRISYFLGLFLQSAYDSESEMFLTYYSNVKLIENRLAGQAKKFESECVKSRFRRRVVSCLARKFLLISAAAAAIIDC